MFTECFKKSSRFKVIQGTKKKLFLGTILGITPKRSKRFQFRLNQKKGLDLIYKVSKFEGDPIIFRGLNTLTKIII